jgi:hypothetical protein
VEAQSRAEALALQAQTGIDFLGRTEATITDAQRARESAFNATCVIH